MEARARDQRAYLVAWRKAHPDYDKAYRARRQAIDPEYLLRRRQSRPTNSAYNLAYHRIHRSEILQRKVANRLRRNEELARLKSRPCMDCGGTFPPECMDFDHRDPKTKRHSLAQMAEYSMESIMSEISKCDLVCANCHRTRTFGKKVEVA